MRCPGTVVVFMGLLLAVQPLLFLFLWDAQFHCPEPVHNSHNSLLDDFLKIVRVPGHAVAPPPPPPPPPPGSSESDIPTRFLSAEDTILPIKRVRETFGRLTSDIKRSNNRQQPLRVLLATKDFVGPVKNGGIGTAFTELALALAEEGHRVTVLLAAKISNESEQINEREVGEGKDNEKRDASWLEDYKAKGVEVIALPASKYTNTYQGSLSSYEVRCAYETYLWLVDRDGEFDVIHFHDWLGLPYFATLAKQEGLHFLNTLLVVQAHGPIMWSTMGGRTFPIDYGVLQSDFMERKAVESADVLISPSFFMLEWMQQNGWVLPKRVYKQFNIRRESIKEGKVKGDVKVNELVYFGRLEARKGVYLFLDALDILLKDTNKEREEKGDEERNQTSNGLEGTKWGKNSFLITFLGKFRQGRNNPWSDIMKIKREKRWGSNVKIQFLRDMDYNEATAYLKGKDSKKAKRLAVMPSLTENSPYTVLECMAMGIPFGASDVGGTTEMIFEADKEKVLFEADGQSLATFLRRAVVTGASTARPSFDLEQNTQDWMEWHASLHPANNEGRKRREEEETNLLKDDLMVSVIITSHNRGKFLRQAVDSIRAQTYRNLEVIVVDDASDDDKTVQELNRLEKEFEKEGQGWKVYRSPRKVGVPSTRNKGAEMATGSHFVIMDDDNIAKPHEIETFVRVAQSTQKRVDIFTCFSDQFNTSVPPANDFEAIGRYTPIGGDVSLGLLSNCFGDTNALMRRDSFLDVGGYLEGGPGFQDWEFFLRSVLQGKTLQVIPEALFWKRASMKDSITLNVAEFSKALNALSAAWTGSMKLAYTHDVSKNNNENGNNGLIGKGGIQPMELRNFVLFAQGLLREEHKNKAGEYEIANSYSQFSSLQGDLGWYYGYKKNDGGFQLFKGCKGGKKWYDKEIGSPYFGINKEEMIPYKNETEAYMPVKRYISASKDFVELRMSLRSWITEHCNETDGVKCQILLDGKTVWERFAPRGIDLRDDVITLELDIGSKLDMVVDPLDNDWCDSIHFTVTITQLVQPRFKNTESRLL